MKGITVITRSFQAGTGGKDGKEFDGESFSRRVAHPIKQLLRDEILERIIVLVNGAPGNSLAERNDKNGEFPTVSALNDAFPKEVSLGRIVLVACTAWGYSTPLNEGLRIAREHEVARVLIWSPEIEMDGYRVREALKHAEQRNLPVVGFLRQRWWERPQWNVCQNTAAVWEITHLFSVGGFDPRCDGTGQTISIPDFGEVPVAGLEDFHALLRMMKHDPDFRWGMVGRASPLIWDTNFPKGSERERNHLAKIGRQYQVMRFWAEEIFPDVSFEQAMDRFFACGHMD